MTPSFAKEGKGNEEIHRHCEEQPRTKFEIDVAIQKKLGFIAILDCFAPKKIAIFLRYHALAMTGNIEFYPPFAKDTFAKEGGVADITPTL